VAIERVKFSEGRLDRGGERSCTGEGKFFLVRQFCRGDDPLASLSAGEGKSPKRREGKVPTRTKITLEKKKVRLTFPERGQWEGAIAGEGTKKGKKTFLEGETYMTSDVERRGTVEGKEPEIRVTPRLVQGWVNTLIFYGGEAAILVLEKGCAYCMESGGSGLRKTRTQEGLL